jgi:hypothetical protein
MFSPPFFSFLTSLLPSPLLQNNGELVLYTSQSPILSSLFHPILIYFACIQELLLIASLYPLEQTLPPVIQVGKLGVVVLGIRMHLPKTFYYFLLFLIFNQNPPELRLCSACRLLRQSAFLNVSHCYFSLTFHSQYGLALSIKIIKAPDRRMETPIMDTGQPTYPNSTIASGLLKT